MKWSFLLPVLLVVAFLPPSHADAAAGSGIAVSRTSHEFRLTLTVERRVYPRNALIRVGLRLTNLSHRDIQFPQVNGSAGFCSGGVEVFDDQAISVYPPAFQVKPGEPLPPSPLCPVPLIGGRQLHPGQSAAGSQVPILRARNLNATLYLARGLWVRTPTVQLLLTPSRPLQTSISHRSGEVSASVQPALGGHQALYLYAISSCQGGRSFSYTFWESLQTQRTLHPDCPNPTFWYAVVGYWGQPVGIIDYVRPKG